MKKLQGRCRLLGLIVGTRWGEGLLVKAGSEKEIRQLETYGYKPEGIGIGYDYNAQLCTLYVEPIKQSEVYHEHNQING